MRSPAIRHILHLEFVLAGYDPFIVREVAVDQDLTLADLARVVRALFGAPQCERHLFTHDPEGFRWSSRRRRWGDRWTMIDLRDPTVIDEANASIRGVLRSGAPLWFAHTCDSSFAVRITPGSEDVVPSTDPAARVVRGERAAPFPCIRDPFAHEVLLDVFGDSEHPQHGPLRRALAAATGPWATYRPARFDAVETQRALDGALGISPAHARGTALDGLVASIPLTARAGLRAHLETVGLELPAVVTADEAAQMVHELRWALARASGAGIALTNGAIDTETLRQGVAALGVDATRVDTLFATARALRFVYARNGRLMTKKAIAAAATNPVTLWNALAQATLEARMPVDRRARELLLLSLADGTASDPAIGLRRAADAYATLSSRPPWSCGGDRSEYHPCDHPCDCPPIDGATWHDVIDASVQDAAHAAEREGYSLIASPLPHADDVGMPPEWMTDPHGPYAVSTAWSGEPAMAVAEDGADNEATFVLAASEFIAFLSLFGLARDDDGWWSVPTPLQQFARTVLQTRYRGWTS